MNSRSCKKSPDFHTAHLSWLGHLAYGTPLRLWRVIPHRLVTRRCDAWRTDAEDAP